VRRRVVIAGTAATLLPGPLVAQSRHGGTRRLGVLMAGSADDPLWKGLADLFVRNLDVLGWRDGENLTLEWRWAVGDGALIERYAIELALLHPDAIFCQTSPATLALLHVTRTIPIVFVRVTDPVGQGFVQSLSRPGGNATGFADYDPPLAGKWLSMLNELSPEVTQATVLYNPATAPYAGLMLRAIEAAGPSFSIDIHTVTIDQEADIEPAIARIAQGKGSSVLALPHIFTTVHRAAILGAVARHRLPAVYADRFMTEAGGLMSYGIDPGDLFRRAALYVSRVLDGIKPGDLPVQNPTKYILAVNLKTASEIGITFPPALVASADDVFE
jgi:putative tryptophan/tyrosine transport system substrate-binding protein